MKFFITLTIILFLFACTTNKKKNLKNTGFPAKEYKTINEDGTWCWFSDPRAVYLDNTTYIACVSSLGNIDISAYNHKTKETQTHTLREAYHVNDHASPSLLITPEDKIMIFYTKHAQKIPIQMHISKNPKDISEWETVRDLYVNDTITYKKYGKSYTYSNPCQLSEEKNKLFIFWRGIDFKPNVSTSIDGGQTWTMGKIFICPERIYKNRRPYLKVTSDGKQKIHFAFTDGHPRRELNNNIYYACYTKNAMYKANGDKISEWDSIPIEPKNSDLVYNAKKEGAKAWVWDVAYDENDFPVIVFATFPKDTKDCHISYRTNDSTKITEPYFANHIYYYARWDGTKWNNSKLVNSGKWFPNTKINKKEKEANYSGGIVIDHENPSIVYLSRLINGVFEIEKWHTHDFGKTWKSEAITMNSAHDNVRPFAVRNAKSDNPLQVLWMMNRKYISYTNYNSAIKANIKND